MSEILVATAYGCRAFTPDHELETELAGRNVTALAAGQGKTCLAVIDNREIWRRFADGFWSPVTNTVVALESIVEVGTSLFGGSRTDAMMVCLGRDGAEMRLSGFDHVVGRDQWFAQGPPLGVRALTATADETVLLAAVHVGGILRSSDGGETWIPTLPIAFDVHEVRAHPSLPTMAMAATAVGLCVSRNAGLTWEVLDEGLDITNSLSVAVLEEEVLFSTQDGPFAERSRVWRWPIGGGRLVLVGSGLPEWLDGKVDTGRMAAGDSRAAIADGGGNLWLSSLGSREWRRIADDVPYGPGLVIV
jgi:hypothetical protein